MVIFCPRCGTQAPDDQSLFCNKCGTQLPLNVPDKPGNRCPNCTTILPDSKTSSCPRCGFLLVPESSSILPVRTTKNCPQCQAPVLDENRYYCKICGAYIRDFLAGKVSVTEESSGSKVSVKKPVIIPGIYQDTHTGTISRPVPDSKKRVFDLLDPMVKKTGILLFILVGIVLLAWGGLTLLDSGPVLPSSGDVLVTQDLSSVTLTINDFPSGWIPGEAGGTDDSYSAQFLYDPENSGALVEQTITRYPGIEEARLELNSERVKVSNLTIEPVNLGNEGFGYIDVNYVMVIFRKGNIIVKIEDTRNEYQDNPTMNNAKTYAEIIAKRFK